MPYIQFENGQAVGLFNVPQPGVAEEYRTDDDPAVVAYIESRAAPPAAPEPSRLEARIALLEEATGNAPDDAAIDAKRAAMMTAWEGK